MQLVKWSEFFSDPGPDLPYLDETQRYFFPNPSRCGDIIFIGGNLSPGMLLSAYEQGIFPWYDPEGPIIWQSPDPRFVIYPETLHISESMRKILKKHLFTIRFDTDFEGVIRNCASVPRPGQYGTWIGEDIIEAYTKLHHLGWAHSAEAYLDGHLVGGCYGIRIGKVFCGESMFALYPNASKAAFLTLATNLFNDEVQFIDCQVPTAHLRSLGGQMLSRPDFLMLLDNALFLRTVMDRKQEQDQADRRGSWTNRYTEIF
ncbi:leucyl/phenylalanyl-tRNA--protein transferase [Gracilinema caldarium]|uniref:leucyl/phenylalanyl-tRNA--protein transferase n=1 Tax=Gracilinema caldarium TaxID=215591 RepID=UPI0026F3759E|nr:leucyl/phenylalanyl-tRNA--protein transferase [Gracilinema caldarium]